MTSVTSGRRCSELLTKQGPLGLSVRMLLGYPLWWKAGYSLMWEARGLYSERRTTFTSGSSSKPSLSKGSAKILSALDTPSSRCLFRLRLSELPIEETESSSLPVLQTPTAVMTCEAPGAMRERAERAERKGYKNGTKYGSLESQINYDPRLKTTLLPTPLAVEREHPDRVDALKAKGATQINSRVNGELRPNGIMDFMNFHGMLKTPCAMDADSDKRTSKGVSGTSGTLAQEVASGYVAKRGLILPTPRTCSAMGASLDTKGNLEGNRQPNLETVIGRMMLPTPNTTDYNTTLSEDAKQRCLERRAAEGKTAFPSKMTQLRLLATDGLLPTPTAGEAEKYRLQYKPGSQMGTALSAMAASGMLPTPQTSDSQAPLTAEQKEKYVAKHMAKGVMPSAAYQLRQMAAEGILPTPMARDYKNPDKAGSVRMERKLAQGRPIELNDLAPMGMLPTPRANKVTEVDLDNPNVANRNKANLEEEISKMVVSGNLPTPSARDWKGKTNPGIVKEGSGCVYGETLPDTIGRLTEPSSPKTAGQTSRLSPLFTEEMMGFPLMWTTLPFLSPNGAPKASKPTETP